MLLSTLQCAFTASIAIIANCLISLQIHNREQKELQKRISLQVTKSESAKCLSKLIKTKNSTNKNNNQSIIIS